VVERAAPDSEASDSRAEPVESFLLRHIRENPGLGFGAIVQAAQAACNVSRATAALHLSRLVRFGDVSLLPDRIYLIAEPGAPAARAIMELRWSDATVIIHPDGSARHIIQQEFRVVSGQLDHIEFGHAKPLRQFIWWCTAASRASRVPATQAPSRLSTDYIEFAAPLIARKAAWHRFCVAEEMPPWYRMACPQRVASRHVAARDEPTHEAESIELPSQDRRFGRRLTSDARLRLQMVFPEGYPVGPARCRVRFLTEPGLIDSVEELRLASLGADQGHQDGLRRFGSTLTLSVPRPRLDREYEITWALPTLTQRDRWLAGERRRIGALIHRPVRRGTGSAESSRH